ncbi:MAG TPA: hypothetical protein PLV52_03800, partial [Candidatus Omnitrophota bacterium]|nr:hypothetical protein [Candidatus Omnitrophota bacterium]
LFMQNGVGAVVEMMAAVVPSAVISSIDTVASQLTILMTPEARTEFMKTGVSPILEKISPATAAAAVTAMTPLAERLALGISAQTGQESRAEFVKTALVSVIEKISPAAVTATIYSIGAMVEKMTVGMSEAQKAEFISTAVMPVLEKVSPMTAAAFVSTLAPMVSRIAAGMTIENKTEVAKIFIASVIDKVSPITASSTVKAITTIMSNLTVGMSYETRTALMDTVVKPILDRVSSFTVAVMKPALTAMVERLTSRIEPKERALFENTIKIFMVERLTAAEKLTVSVSGEPAPTINAGEVESVMSGVAAVVKNISVEPVRSTVIRELAAVVAPVAVTERAVSETAKTVSPAPEGKTSPLTIAGTIGAATQPSAMTGFAQAVATALKTEMGQAFTRLVTEFAGSLDKIDVNTPAGQEKAKELMMTTMAKIDNLVSRYMPQITRAIDKLDMRTPEGRASAVALVSMVVASVGTAYVSIAAELAPLLAKVDMTPASPRGQQFVSDMISMVASGLGNTFSNMMLKMAPSIVTQSRVQTSEQDNFVAVIFQTAAVTLQQQFSQVFQAFSVPMQVMSAASPQGLISVRAIGNAFASIMNTSINSLFQSFGPLLKTMEAGSAKILTSSIVIQAMAQLSKTMTDTVKAFDNIRGGVGPVIGADVVREAVGTSGGITGEALGTGLSEFNDVFNQITSGMPLPTAEGGTVSSVSALIDSTKDMAMVDKMEKFMQFAFGLGYQGLASGSSLPLGGGLTVSKDEYGRVSVTGQTSISLPGGKNVVVQISGGTHTGTFAAIADKLAAVQTMAKEFKNTFKTDATAQAFFDKLTGVAMVAMQSGTISGVSIQLSSPTKEGVISYSMAMGDRGQLVASKGYVATDSRGVAFTGAVSREGGIFAGMTDRISDIRSEAASMD